MKKSIFLSLALAGMLHAGIVDGIALTVNGKVITMYEIVKLSDSAKISRQDAVEKLIERRLEEAELAKQDIKIDDFEVDKRIEQIAAQNSLSVAQFQDAVTQKTGNFDAYKKQLKESMQREKLFQKITHDSYAPMNEADLKLFYENNKASFAMPGKIDAIQYSSKDKMAIEQLVATPLADVPNVAKEEVTIDTASLDSSLAYILRNTKDGSYTQIMPVQDKYVVFYIKDKKDIATPPFESVRNEVFEKMNAQKQEDAIKGYFEKLKASAKIKVLRLPN